MKRKTWMGCRAVTLAILAAGCAPDPWTNGRYWRQPAERRARVHADSTSVGLHGETADAGIGPGFEVSGTFQEVGGAGAGSAGQTAQSGYWPGVGMVAGSAGGAARSGVCADTLVWPGVTGTSALSGSFGETSAQSGSSP